MSIPLVLEKTIGFSSDRNTPYCFFVVGAGGTGGHLLPNLIRQIGIRNREMAKEGRRFLHSITIVDEDTIEEKNLLRQNFTTHDLGKNKAEVMAKRYGRAFGVEVNYIPEYITSPEHLIEMLKNTSEIEGFHFAETKERSNISMEKELVLIDATDNNKTRLVLETVLSRFKNNAYLLSSGNEERAGQVLFTSHGFSGQGAYSSSLEPYFSLMDDVPGLFREFGPTSTPSFFEIFPTAAVEKLPTEVSCAEATMSAPQNMAANLTAANILFGFCNKLLAYEPIRHFLVFFDTDTMVQKTYRFTRKDIRAALSLTPNNYALGTYLGETITDGVKPPTWEDAVRLHEEEEKKKQEELKKILAGVTPS